MAITIRSKPARAKSAAAGQTAAPSLLGGKFRTLPTALTHYTNLRGLMGIIDNNEIWASNVSFLNDRRELLYGVDAAAKVIRKFSSSKTYSEWHKALDSALTRLKEGRIPNTYAACFCERSDLLSQWRGYGGSEQGIAITLKRSKLDAVLAGSKASLLPVVYGQLKTAGQITKELNEKLDDLEQAARADNYSENEKEEEAYSLLSRLLPQFKHIGFEDEKEWRIVVQHKTLRSIVHFRPNANVVVPYLKLKLSVDGKIPFGYVRVGPGRDQELTKRSVELYLQSKGYTDVEVRLSNVPFRL